MNQKGELFTFNSIIHVNSPHKCCTNGYFLHSSYIIIPFLNGRIVMGCFVTKCMRSYKCTGTDCVQNPSGRKEPYVNKAAHEIMKTPSRPYVFAPRNQKVKVNSFPSVKIKLFTSHVRRILKGDFFLEFCRMGTVLALLFAWSQQCKQIILKWHLWIPLMAQ